MANHSKPEPMRLPSRLIASAPLYLQIADSLLERIESGELAPGDRLPAERELSELLGVNRMTLRQALEKLEVQGLLTRRQGDGTFISEPKIERHAGKLVPFTREMRRRGFKPGARVITFERRPAESSVAKELGLATCSTIYFIRRLRFLNKEPAMIENFAMPVRRFPKLERFDLAERSVYEIMESEYGVRVVRARQSLEPTVATEFEAQHLAVEKGSALMLERRLAFDRDDQPVEHGRDLYRGDRFRFVTDMAPLEF